MRFQNIWPLCTGMIDTMRLFLIPDDSAAWHQEYVASKLPNHRKIIDNAIFFFLPQPVHWDAQMMSGKNKQTNKQKKKKIGRDRLWLEVPSLRLVTYKISHLPPHMLTHTHTHLHTPCSRHPWACPSTWSWHVQTTLHETVAFLPLVCHLLLIS